MALDPARFPAAAAYLDSLPDALASYPECKVTSETYENLRTDLGPGLLEPSLPDAVRSFLRGRHTDRWLPETVANCLLLVARDRAFRSDDDFLKWTYQDSCKVFRRPLYRALMLVLSPALVVMGAAKRWSSFHAGTDLVATPPARKGNTIETYATLSHPPNLFTGLLLPRQTQAFKAALECARAKEAHVHLEVRSNTESVFRASWRA